MISFLAELCKIFQDTAIDYRSHENGVLHTRSDPGAIDVANERMIQYNWDRLATGYINPKQFIDVVKYRVGGCKFFACQLAYDVTLTLSLHTFLLNSLDSPAALRRGLLPEAGTNLLQWVHEQEDEHNLPANIQPHGDHDYVQPSDDEAEMEDVQWFIIQDAEEVVMDNLPDDEPDFEDDEWSINEVSAE